ncbi:MAG: amidohydrolase [Deltaproteobacteria bacterium]|nr:amidohydrolase [Deltaproteobacteria bacterium]
MEHHSADILVINGTLLPLDQSGTIIEKGSVAVKEGKIVAAGPCEEMASWRSKEMIDAGGCIVMPGLVNAHTHLPMSLFRGLADDLPLMTWLNEYIFPAEASHVNPETVRIGALLSCAEMLLSGTTTCCDGYFFEDSVARSVFEVGIRGVLGQGVIDYPAPGVPEPSKNIEHAVSFVKTWKGKTPLITPSIFCHSPYTCSKETLAAAAGEARSRDVLFQIHVAETRSEHERMKKEKGLSPVQYLDKIGVLGPGTLLIHAVWVDEEDIRIIADSGAGIAHNPESNMKLASGIAPVPEFIKEGLTVGIGTDGCASNNNLDLFAEMDSTAKLHKVNTFDPTVMSAETVLNMATQGGARAIGLESQIGSLEVGKQADLIVVDMQKPHLVPMYNPVSHLVYAAKGSDVRDVVIDGKVVVRDYTLLTIDQEKLFKEAEAASMMVRKTIP